MQVVEEQVVKLKQLQVLGKADVTCGLAVFASDTSAAANSGQQQVPSCPNSIIENVLSMSSMLLAGTRLLTSHAMYVPLGWCILLLLYALDKASCCAEAAPLQCRQPSLTFNCIMSYVILSHTELATCLQLQIFALAA